MNLKFSFIIIILISSIFISIHPSYSEASYFFDYSIISNYSGNVTIKQGSFSVTSKVTFNINASLLVFQEPINNTCYILKLNLNGTLKTNYSLFASMNINYPLKFSNSTILCSIKDLWKKIFEQNFTQTALMQNYTPFINYNFTAQFVGVEKINNITSLHIKSLIDSNGNLKSNGNFYNYKLNSTIDIYLSVPQNILLKANLSSILYLESVNDNTIMKYNLIGDMNILLRNTNYHNFYHQTLINIHSFKTNLGVDFAIVTNTTLKSININGASMTLSTEGNYTTFLMIFYGKPKLGISIENIDIKIDNIKKDFSLIYMFDYAIISVEFSQSQRTIDIDLGANVGVYNYSQASPEIKQTGNVGWFNVLYTVIIALTFSILIILLLRKRSTFKSS